MRPGAAPSAHIQTIFGRAWSTLARRLPSELNVIIETPRGGPEGSVIMADAEGPDASAYSRSPSAVVNRSRQILGECCSIWETCASDIRQVN